MSIGHVLFNGGRLSRDYRHAIQMREDALHDAAQERGITLRTLTPKEVKNMSNVGIANYLDTVSGLKDHKRGMSTLDSTTLAADGGKHLLKGLAWGVAGVAATTLAALTLPASIAGTAVVCTLMPALMGPMWHVGAFLFNLDPWVDMMEPARQKNMTPKQITGEIEQDGAQVKAEVAALIADPRHLAAGLEQRQHVMEAMSTYSSFAELPYSFNENPWLQTAPPPYHFAGQPA